MNGAVETIEECNGFFNFFGLARSNGQFYFLKNEEGRVALDDSDVFAQETRSPDGFGSGLEGEPVSQENKESYLVTKLLYLVSIANQVAYAVTYGEHLELNPVTSLDGGRVKFRDSAQLWRELRHIRYNLVSNGGSYFLAQSWDRLLADILESLRLG